MKHKSLARLSCPIARSLERVGEWWSILILRDALHGYTRFDQFQKSLGIAPNMLSRRLDALVKTGLLERRRYSERPPRYEYLPTARGRDFKPVLIALLAWGNKHFAPEGHSVLLVDRRTGATAEPTLFDQVTGQPITEASHRLTAGPAAPASTRRRYGPHADSRAGKRPGARARAAS
jgi:DNA-binding HxlR family transcriptional regulator